MSKAFNNAKKIGNTEVVVATAEFDVTADTTAFDLGDTDLSQAGIRIEVVYNGVTLENSDWEVDSSDNTIVNILSGTIVDGDEINFKVFLK